MKKNFVAQYILPIVLCAVIAIPIIAAAAITLQSQKRPSTGAVVLADEPVPLASIGKMSGVVGKPIVLFNAPEMKSAADACIAGGHHGDSCEWVLANYVYNGDKVVGEVVTLCCAHCGGEVQPTVRETWMYNA